jgi:hypothetical protein
MNSLDKFSVRDRCSRCHFFALFFGVLILFLTSCTCRPEPYSILEFTGADAIQNYSKSLMLVSYESDSLNPVAVPGSKGDLFAFDEYGFIYNDKSSQNKFLFRTTDDILYVNDNIISLDIPTNDSAIAWFEKMKEMDFSALQFINFKSKIKESYLPYLNELAKTRPNAGISFGGDFGEMTELLKIFNPGIITGPALSRSDYDQLSKLTNLEILMVTLDDSIFSDPLPAMPELEQLFLTNIDEDITLTNDLLVNNKQIERVIIWKSGSFDLAILNPLVNLKELVVTGIDSIENPGLINNQKNLEVLSITGDNLVYDPDLIKLPYLRWMAFPYNVTQEEFNSFIVSHPNLEMIEIIGNDTIRSLQPLSRLRNLYGLTVTDTVTDISAIKTLTNLKFLSLPDDLLDDTLMKAELQNSLPDTRIVANEGFCLGSGWLLLIIPLVLILRYFGRQRGERLQDEVKS